MINFEKALKESVEKSWEDYKKSDDWKCEKSPSGGHYYSCRNLKYVYPMMTIEKTCNICKKVKIVCVKVD